MHIRERVAEKLGWTCLHWDSHGVVLWGLPPEGETAMQAPRWELDSGPVSPRRRIA